MPKRKWHISRNISPHLKLYWAQSDMLSRWNWLPRLVWPIFLLGLALNLFSIYSIHRYHSQNFSRWHEPAQQAPVRVSQDMCTTCCETEKQLLAHNEMQTKALKQQMMNQISLSAELSETETKNGVKAAVVIPFVRCQVFGRLPQTLKAWETFPPCTENETGFGELHLIFNYNSNLENDREVLEELRENSVGPEQEMYAKMLIPTSQ